MDAAAVAGVAGAARAAAAAVFARPAACGLAVDLLVASSTRSPAVVHRFPDDSSGRTTVASGGEGRAPREQGCVLGTDGPERLVGHRVSTILAGGGGDDVLVAAGGVTVRGAGPRHLRGRGSHGGAPARR